MYCESRALSSPGRSMLMLCLLNLSNASIARDATVPMTRNSEPLAESKLWEVSQPVFRQRNVRPLVSVHSVMLAGVADI
jgi:hypothetical protein